MVDTAGEYESLFSVYWPVGLAVLVVVWAAIVVLAIRYRRRRGDESWPEQIRERRRIEVGYVALLAGVAAALVTLTFSTMAALEVDLPAQPAVERRSGPGPGQDPAPVTEIRVVGARWNWRFEYPEYGIEQTGTGTQIPTLVVPVGNVRFSVTSVDVIHSLFVPELRFKRDALPGRDNRFTLGFSEPAYWPNEGRCAEFCGLRHAYMGFNVRVLDRADFRRWALARRAGRPQERTPALDDDGDFE